MKALYLLISLVLIHGYGCSMAVAQQVSYPFPYKGFIAVTKSDSSTLVDQASKPVQTRGIMVGTNGNLALKDYKGNSVTILALTAGVIYPIQTNHVLSTGTTATNITAFW